MVGSTFLLAGALFFKTLLLSNGEIIQYSLTLSKTTVFINECLKTIILVNGQSPGPTIRASFGDWLNVTVINEISDDMTVVHWHGMTQRNTQYNDGPPGINQCPMNYQDPETGVYLSTINNVNTMNYLFKPQSSGTFWYHGHFHEQYVDGLLGPLIVDDSDEVTAAYEAKGASYEDETILVLTDWYNAPAKDMLPYYLSPASGGDEPHPEAIAVNNKLTNLLTIPMNRNTTTRVRIINAAAFSMFKISVDGMPLKVIELDGGHIQPHNVSDVVINVAQRVSFLLDWSLLDTTIANSSSIVIRVDAIPEMYPPYDPDEENLGLYATTSHRAYHIYWTGIIQFNNEVVTSSPSYNISSPPQNTYPPPSDTNFLDALPLIDHVVPESDLHIYYLIEFFANSEEVNLPHVNGQTFPGITREQLGKPMLYDYMSAQGGALKENNDYPVGSSIQGDAIHPFVLPFNRTIDVMINNTDGGEHPLHLHGHTFWVIRTSDYDSGHPVQRDVVSVPASGWALIRFVSDNPGVWMFHCHIDWHARAGFITNIIEAPSLIKNTIDAIPATHRAACTEYFNAQSSSSSKSTPITERLEFLVPIIVIPIVLALLLLSILGCFYWNYCGFGNKNSSNMKDGSSGMDNKMGVAAEQKEP